jgi:hypothetical protein
VRERGPPRCPGPIAALEPSCQSMNDRDSPLIIVLSARRARLSAASRGQVPPYPVITRSGPQGFRSEGRKRRGSGTCPSPVRAEKLAVRLRARAAHGLMHDVNVAAKWYESATFWSAAGVVATVLVGVAAAVVTSIVGFPRRRLMYGLPVVAPMLTSAGTDRGELELSHHGRQVREPYVAEVELVSRGRRDIPSTAYDRHEPIQLDIGTVILELLKVTCEPQSLPVPTAIADGSTLKIGPSLIGKHQKITLTLLTEGRPSPLIVQHSLIDVQVLRQLVEPPRQKRGCGLSILVGTITLVGYAYGVAWLQSHLGKSATNTIIQVFQWMLLVAAFGYIGIDEFKRYRRRRQ